VNVQDCGLVRPNWGQAQSRTGMAKSKRQR